MSEIESRMIDMKAVGERLRALIGVQYSSVGEFADRAGLSRNTLYRITCGAKIPSLYTLLLICDRLGCSLDFLLGIASCDSDPLAAWQTALLCVHEFGPKWKQEDRSAMACAAVGLLTDRQVMNLLSRMKKEGPPSK